MARVWEQRDVSEARQQATLALLEAAERLLFESGYAAVTTRRVAEEAGVKHGLVHYYFGSMEELFTQTLERLANRLAEPLEEHYANPDLTFAEKWRIVAQNWIDQPTSRFPKILLELSAMSWNIPQLRQRVSAVYARFRAIFERYFGEAMREYGLDESQFPLKVVAAAAGTFQLGVIVEGLSQFHEGHEELLTWVQSWLDSLEAAKTANA
ncbi:MAG TPA: TetR/AcrR family transcriptional regulator [Acidimicrobiia bacterium]|jgi:AcrR family transcriptional regulator|nr:TetR/AcrR family transcriptional regulator [Acidimicrobiia bacterium]